MKKPSARLSVMLALLFVVGAIAVYRIGFYTPSPSVDMTALSSAAQVQIAAR